MTARAVAVALATTLAVGGLVTSSEAKQVRPTEGRSVAPVCEVIDQYTAIDYWEKRNGTWIERTITFTVKRCTGPGYTPGERVVTQVFGPWRPSVG